MKIKLVLLVRVIRTTTSNLGEVGVSFFPLKTSVDYSGGWGWLRSLFDRWGHWAPGTRGCPSGRAGSHSQGWPGGFSHEAGWESTLAPSGCRAGVSAHAAPAVIAQRGTPPLAAEELGAEGGADARLVPSRAGYFLSPPPTRRRGSRCWAGVVGPAWRWQPSLELGRGYAHTLPAQGGPPLTPPSQHCPPPGRVGGN